MPLQVSRADVQVPTAEELTRWRSEFDERHSVQVRGLVEPALLAWIRERLAAAPFAEHVHPTDPPSVELVMKDDALQVTLWSLFNDARLFAAIRSITGCDAIGSFLTRVYAMDPSPDHFDAWHDDLDGNRMVAMSINLGDPYEGGVLRLRKDGRIVREVANTGAGDAVIFRLQPGLDHIVTPVVGTRRKMALAGWFQRTPVALAVLKRAADRRG